MKNAIKLMFGTLCPWGKFWLYMGLAALVAAAWMSFSVGWKMTAAHALFLAILSAVTAFLPMAAEKVWSEGRKAIALSLGLLSIPLFAIEFGQHAAYTAGIRGHDLIEARVQNTRYAGAQKTVKENEALIAMLERRLADLESRNGWSASVTADALRAKLPGLNLAIELESKRGGCKQICEARTRERDEIQSRIAVLEERKDLTDRIMATKKAIEGLRTRADTVEHKSSQTEHMNAFLSKAVALVGQGTLKPSEMTEESTQLSANLAMALAGTGLPALALFIAGLYRRKEDEPIVVSVSRETIPAKPVIIREKADMSEFWRVIHTTLNQPAKTA